MKHKILLITLLIVHFVNGQEKIYYDADRNLTSKISLAFAYKITEKSAANTDSLFKETFYYLTGEKKSESSYINIYKHRKLKEKKNTGEWWEWFANGNIQLKAFYEEGQLQGDFCTYWPNGKQRRKDIFEKGKLVEGNCFDSTGNKITKYFPYETWPMFPGGEEKLFKFISNSIKYPTDMQVAVNGTAYTEFFVEANGKISNIRTVHNNNTNIDREAIRVVKSMPDWIPSTHEGQNVRAKLMLPISFDTH